MALLETVLRQFCTGIGFCVPFSLTAESTYLQALYSGLADGAIKFVACARVARHGKQLWVCFPVGMNQPRTLNTDATFGKAKTAGLWCNLVSQEE